MSPLRVLLVKCWQPISPQHSQPPLGILYLVSSLRARFGADVEVHYWDLRLFSEPPEDFASKVAADYDLIGVSALSFEADVSHRFARAAKARSPRTVLALGGPYTHSAPERARAMGGFDWVFDGEAERTLPEAVERRFFSGRRDLSGIPGLSWRDGPDSGWTDNGGEDAPDDLDALPMPAWDLVPFDVYARLSNMNGTLHADRYAPLFTSRGCPYKCNFCHDVFGKSYRWRSAASVLAEIEHLKEVHGVGEFQVVDDIYNLHKPRLRAISKGVVERFGERTLWFCFPNGVRGDILDETDLRALRAMGAYQMSISIETVTPRLQTMIEKRLDLPKARKAIETASGLGLAVRGLFMLGFPGESVEEIEATVRFAVDSSLTFASFLLVVPQQGTPIHELAKQVDAKAAEEVSLKDYYSDSPWYQLAYGVDLPRLQRKAYRRFYFAPARMLGILRHVPLRPLLDGAWLLFKIACLPAALRAKVDRWSQRSDRSKADACRLETAEKSRRWRESAPPRRLEAAAA